MKKIPDCQCGEKPYITDREKPGDMWSTVKIWCKCGAYAEAPTRAECVKKWYDRNKSG